MLDTVPAGGFHDHLSCLCGNRSGAGEEQHSTREEVDAFLEKPERLPTKGESAASNPREISELKKKSVAECSLQK